MIAKSLQSIADNLVSGHTHTISTTATDKPFFMKTRFEANIRYYAKKCRVCSWVTVIDGAESNYYNEAIPCQYCNHHQDFVRFFTFTTDHSDLDFENVSSEWLEKHPDETEFYQTKLDELKIMKYL